MPKQLCDLVSRHFYNGRIKDGADKDQPECLTIENTDPLNPKCEYDESNSRRNEKHAKQVVKLVRQLLEEGIDPKQIGVITPYRAQTALIRSLIRDELDESWSSSSVEVGTIHTFQGREKEVIIFDLTDAEPFGAGRLLDERGPNGKDAIRLLNVAFSRARSKLILLLPIRYVQKRYEGRVLQRIADELKANHEIVSFPDSNLEKAIRKAMGKPEGPIPSSELENLSELYAENMNIRDLNGIQLCVNLETLVLDQNQISDISPLKELVKLRSLWLRDNRIWNLEPLRSLADLEILHLENNQISDISPLSKLIKLKVLVLKNNRISDLAPLESLSNLQSLVLSDNKVSNIAPLSSLTNLRRLYLERNKISDISPLLQNPGLGKGVAINIKGNSLSLQTFKEHIPKLEKRGITVLHDFSRE